MKRAIIDLCLFVAVLFLPWWLVFPLAFFVAFSLPYFFEIICAGLFVDSLFSVPRQELLGLRFALTLLALCLLLLAEFLKKKIRFTERFSMS